MSYEATIQESTPMALPGTNTTRIDALMRVSDQIYPILEQNIDGEIRARQVVRLSMAAAATALRGGATPSEAGAVFDTRLSYELRSVNFGPFDNYRTHVTSPPPKIEVPSDIAELANRYADTLRGTHLADHSREPDCIHALHLAALATLYARAYYPELDADLVALYCLIHDLPEAYTGDIQTFKIGDDELELKKQNEAKAIQSLKSDYGKKWPQFIEIIEAYESLEGDEAAFVKTMDKNDPGYTHFRNGAHALRTRHGMSSIAEFRAQADKNTLRTLDYASRFPLVLQDKEIINDHIAAFLE